jgi:hypothetical protein
MSAIEGLDGLHLHDDASLHGQVRLVTPDHGPSIENYDALLLNEIHLGFA